MCKKWERATTHLVIFALAPLDLNGGGAEVGEALDGGAADE